MRIRVTKTLSHYEPGSRCSYRATPEMGVIKHFPRKICQALIEKGAEEVPVKREATKPTD